MAPPTQSSSQSHQEPDNSEDWLKVLDRFIDGGSHGVHEGGDSTNDLFFFEGEFNDSGTHARGSLGFNSNINRSSSSSLLLYHSLELESERKIPFKSGYDERQGIIGPYSSTATADNSDMATKSIGEYGDVSDGDEDLEESEPGSESFDRASKNERKRSLEKRRREDTRSHFQTLANNLRDIEQEFLALDGADSDLNTSNQKSTINKAMHQSTEASLKKGKPPNSNNRCDLISRANKALLRLQQDCRKLRNDNKRLRKVVTKMSEYSSTTTTATLRTDNTTPIASTIHPLQTTVHPPISTAPVTHAPSSIHPNATSSTSVSLGLHEMSRNMTMNQVVYPNNYISIQQPSPLVQGPTIMSSHAATSTIGTTTTSMNTSTTTEMDVTRTASSNSDVPASVFPYNPFPGMYVAHLIPHPPIMYMMQPMLHPQSSATISFLSPNVPSPWMMNPGLVSVNNTTGSTLDPMSNMVMNRAHPHTLYADDDSSASVDADRGTSTESSHPAVRRCDGNLAHCA